MFPIDRIVFANGRKSHILKPKKFPPSQGVRAKNDASRHCPTPGLATSKIHAKSFLPESNTWTLTSAKTGVVDQTPQNHPHPRSIYKARQTQPRSVYKARQSQPRWIYKARQKPTAVHLQSTAKASRGQFTKHGKPSRGQFTKHGKSQPRSIFKARQKPAAVNLQSTTNPAAVSLQSTANPAAVSLQSTANPFFKHRKEREIQCVALFENQLTICVKEILSISPKEW